MQTGARADEIRAAIVELEREIEELESGVHPTPPAPYTRGSDTREHRAGAPLWQLVDFRRRRLSRRSCRDRGGARGSGDPRRLGHAVRRAARPRHRGRAARRGRRRARRTAAGGRARAGDRRRRRGVGGRCATRLLDAIGLGESDATVWVSSGGRFRNGVLRGAWHKAAAAFIGHTAREAARRARLAELQTAPPTRGPLSSPRSSSKLAELARRQARARTRAGGAAVGRGGPRRGRRAGRRRGRARRARTAARRRSRREQQAQAAEQEAGDALHADAADLGLPPSGDELAEVEAALGRLRETLAALWPAISRRERAEQRARAGDGGRARGRGRARPRRRRGSTEAEHQLGAAVERRDTLQATAGAAIAELERRLGEVAGALTANDAAQRGTEDRLGEAQRADGAAEALSGSFASSSRPRPTRGSSAVDGLRRFATTGLIAVALPETEALDPDAEWNVTQALRLAREIEQALSADPDEDARWQRLQRQVTDELGALADALRRHGNNAAASFREDGIVVEVTFRATHDEPARAGRRTRRRRWKSAGGCSTPTSARSWRTISSARWRARCRS